MEGGIVKKPRPASIIIATKKNKRGGVLSITGSAKTYHAGANKERTVWLAEFRRDLKTEGHNDSVRSYIQEKIVWGLKRVKRNKAKAGGL